MRSSIFGTSLVISLSVTLAACGSSGTKVGDACDSGTPCSDGQTCDLTDPNGPSCLDNDGDIDGDGIPNSMDKCDHMPGGLYDEDGDGIGDECDACPIAKPPAIPDTDHDGVDSPCDPNPDTDGEKIVMFDGFNGGAIPTGWVASSAAWQVKGGEAIMTPSDPSIIESLSAPLTLTTSHTVLLSAYRVDQVTPAATESDAAVAGVTDLPMGKTFAQCGSQRTGGADALLVTTSNGTMTKTFTNLFDPAGLYNVLEQLEGAQANCAMVAPSQSGAVQTSSAGNSPNKAELIARGATVRFEYLLVVQKPN